MKQERDKKENTESHFSPIPQNPNTMLFKGETVLDLGAVTGIDCYVAAKQVGVDGKVIGIARSREMLQTVMLNIRKAKNISIEFRQGGIEHLPVTSETIDAVISHGLINLVSDKQQAFREIYRVLKPGGRAILTDVVLTKELSEEVRNSPDFMHSSLVGAIMRNDYLALINDAGFKDVTILEEVIFPLGYSEENEQKGVLVATLKIFAVKESLGK
jgi:SAM-dependent methyltransferase